MCEAPWQHKGYADDFRFMLHLVLEVGGLTFYTSMNCFG